MRGERWGRASYQDLVNFRDEILERLQEYADEQDYYADPVLAIYRDELAWPTAAVVERYNAYNSDMETYELFDFFYSDGDIKLDPVNRVAEEWIFIE